MIATERGFRWDGLTDYVTHVGMHAIYPNSANTAGFIRTAVGNVMRDIIISVVTNIGKLPTTSNLLMSKYLDGVKCKLRIS